MPMDPLELSGNFKSVTTPFAAVGLGFRLDTGAFVTDMVSRRTSDSGLSSRSPLKTGARRLPSAVQAVKDTSQTNSGLTHSAGALVAGRFLNGHCFWTKGS